ncbi:MAG TPA: hypothetical protein VEU72_00585 [Nitrosopumilaceae archaeon]|nr:hypothetical protein [Nitrosopumilaceae archaeon]
MNSKLESKLDTAIKEFNKKAILEISPKTYYAKGKPTPVNVTKNQIKNALKKICPEEKTKLVTKDMIEHFEDLEKLVPFCSSPRSFRSAWDLRSNILNKYDADTLVNEGAQLIPNNKNLRLFQAIQQGVELGINQRLVAFVRHSEGNYDDSLDDQGRFEYQPPADATGMLRYRWCQFLSEKLQIPFLVIAVMWFEYRIDSSSNLVFVAAPAKIIEYTNDLKDLGNSLSNPLKLKLVNRSEVYNAINLLRSLGQTNLEVETRPELPLSLAREWSFDRINSSHKGRSLKRWAQKMGHDCPGNLCNHIKFAKLDTRKIAFGHIVSQDWARSFTFLLDRKDHPDNLYLTCQSCNSSLGDRFPDTELRNAIEKRGTIGDWLRKDEQGIRFS